MSTEVAPPVSSPEPGQGLAGNRQVEPPAATAARERVGALESERDKALAEAENWRWDATAARRDLYLLQTSRIWRLANLYWRARRRLRSLLGGGARAWARAVRAGAAKPAQQSPPAGAGAIPAGFPPIPKGRYDVLVLSVIDWDFRFQRPQQLATQFGRQGHRVFYLSTSQFLTAGEPAWKLARKGQNVVELRVRMRRPLDIYAGRLERKDLEVLESSISALLEDLALGDVVLWVQISFWSPLADRLRKRYGWRVVYDCMDEWENFPGIGEAVLALEPGLVAGADLTVVTAGRLADKYAGRASRLVVAKNGVDPEHYRLHYRENDLLRAVRHPVIGYFGALAAWVDIELLERICRRFPEATVVLAGGVFDIDVGALRDCPNLRLLGQRPYSEIPQLLYHFDVCIIPFLSNATTDATDPVKFYEYMWSGKPVVSTRLPELLPYQDLCYLARGHEQFLQGIEQALAEPVDDPRRQLRQKVAASNTWSERYRAVHAETLETFPLVSVVVVAHGGLPLTRRCLESLLEGETWPRLEVVVVDNASPDGTADHLRRLSAGDRRLRCLFQDRNLGFPAATNLGIAAAGGDVVVLLNNDTVVAPGMIGRLCRHLRDNPKLGLLCPTTNFCGNQAKVDAAYHGLSEMPSFAAGRARRHAGRLLDLPVAAMYCVAARRRLLDEIGPLDEAFGIGMFEDDDYSLRVRAAGYQVACAEDAYVHHVGQGSFQALSPEDYQALWQRNQEHYEKKWGRKWEPHTLRAGVAPVASKIGAGSRAREPVQDDYRSQAAAESRKWGSHLRVEASGAMNAWLDHPWIRDHYRARARIEGQDWVEWVPRQLGRPAARSLELGCGAGSRSLGAWEVGASAFVEGIDLSAERVAAGEAIRREREIPGEFRVEDVNTLELEPGRYDLVFSAHSFHHFLALEHVMEQVAGALTPSGLFVLEEFVGPTQFQWTDRQMAITASLTELIPEDLRRFRWRAVKSREGRPAIAEVVAASPFESIRSAEIAALFERYFEVVLMRSLGGTVQHLLYNGIIHNFWPVTEVNSRYLTAIMAVEDGLIDAGLLPSDFMLLVGRRRQQSAAAGRQ